MPYPGMPYPTPTVPWGYPFVALPDGKTAKPTVAAIFWALVLVRDLIFLGIASILWMETANFGGTPAFPFALVNEPGLLVAITILGVGASAMALVFDLSRTKHWWGTVAGAISAAACITPGLLFGVGIVGLSMSAIALVLHLMSREEFARFEERARAARGLRAP
jgi:hypothetical protein